MTTTCDKCSLPAKYSLSGYLYAHYLCANCAAYICLSVGDQAGYDKFKAVSNA